MTTTKFRFETSREGNKRLRQLSEERGLPYFAEHNLGRLNAMIEFLEKSPEPAPAAPKAAPAPIPPAATPAPAAAAPAPAPVAKPAPAPAAATTAPAKPSGPATFGDAVAGIMAAEKKAKAEAIMLAVARHPDLHREWLKGDTSKIDVSAKSASPKNFLALVDAAIAGGKSKAQAVCYIVSAFPAVYSEWRKTGDTSKL